MKKIFILTVGIMFLLLRTNFVFSQLIYLEEDFENGIPVDWIVSDEIWTDEDGGYIHPEFAYQGVKNALFRLESINGETSMLITPPINLETGIKPELTFFHAQEERYTFQQWRNDELRVYYKEHVDSTWKILKEYTTKISTWTEHTLLIPDTVLTKNFYLGFEGTAYNGYGVCIDSIKLIETGIIPRYIEDINVIQASRDFVPTGSTKNAILKLEILVKGNDGDVLLDSIGFTSLNTSDDNILTNGVKLYAASENDFDDSELIGTSTSFSGGFAVFDNLNYTLQTGYSYIWLTYDIIEDTNHELHQNVLDAKIETNGIKINGNYYPLIDESPNGQRLIYEAILFDNFETDKGWTYVGEFERAKPLGLGGSSGTPDPDYAFSGEYIIGTDLTGQGATSGDYEINLTEAQYRAESPYFDLTYYKDVYLYYRRWLNVDGSDTATLDYSRDAVDNWSTYFQNPGLYTSTSWTLERFNLNNELSRRDNVAIRFTLGPTNDFWEFSGWNIDDVVLVGNYISKDVGVIDWLAPTSGCGHTDTESVQVTIKNFAGEPVGDTTEIPISYSFDGTNRYYDTININLAVGGTYTHTINKPYDLTTPGWYSVDARTHMSGDEDTDNDTYSHDLFISPTYELPYSENFESDFGYYRTGGDNTSWEYGIPEGLVIKNAASGEYTWITNKQTNYNLNESSFVESPCFNFSGIGHSILQFNLFGLSENQTDGLAIHYSIDDGETWVFIPERGSYPWNWYNEVSITELGTAGFDDTEDEWKLMRVQLPDALMNQSSVKFRFVFESDGSSVEEGFAIDDIAVYESPIDVGVTTMTYPSTQCELSDTTHVRFYLKNYGLNTIPSGTKIPVGIDFKGTYYTTDTIVLGEDLAVNSEVKCVMDTTLDMSYAGDFDIRLYTLKESDPFFYSTTCNDTLESSVTVQGMPRYNPFPDVIGVSLDDPIDVDLNAKDGYTTYVWDGGTHLTDSTRNITEEDTVYVTVTNAIGCTAVDSVKIVGSRTNNDLSNLTSSNDIGFPAVCERNEKTEISVDIDNNGLDDYASGDTIFIAFQVDKNDIVEDTLILSSQFLKTDPPINYTFKDSCDLTEPGSHTLKVFHNFPKDLDPYNDTVTQIVLTKGYIDVDLEYDTIYSSQADTLKLVVTPDSYDSYLWNTTDDNDTLTITSNASQWYKVTVSDAFACTSSNEEDSTYIETYDMSINELIYPVDTCENHTGIQTHIKFALENNSGNTYAADETVSIYYKYDEENWESESIVLGKVLNANDTIHLIINNAIDNTTPGEHSLYLATVKDIDANKSNDTSYYEFNTWANPKVDLLFDTILTTEADTVLLIAQDGFASYTWNDGPPATTNDSLYVTSLSSYSYIVTVADIHSCGTDSDKTTILTYNIGVSDLVNPVSACRHETTEEVIVEYKNYGNDNIPAGETIRLGYIFGSNEAIIEDVTLVTDLTPNQTRTHTFSGGVDVKSQGTYMFKAFLEYSADVYVDDDTIVAAIKTHGYPVVELGEDIYTTDPDTVILVADPGYRGYYWNNASRNDSLEVRYNGSASYSVTVSDDYGCHTIDDIDIYAYNFGISAVNSPASSCELSNNASLNVAIYNYGTDTLDVGDQIPVSYTLNGGSVVNDMYDVTGEFLPSTSQNFTFSANLDLTTTDNNTLTVTASYPNDVVPVNNSTSVNIDAYGYPTVSLGNDVYNVDPASVTLRTTEAFSSYLWSDGVTTTRDFDVSFEASKEYSVTATDANGCPGNASVWVYSYDFSPSSLVSPVEACELSSAETVSLEIRNNSKDTLDVGDELSVSYTLDGGTAINETMIITSKFYPETNQVHNFAARPDLSENKTYGFVVSVSHQHEANTSNDGGNYSVDYLKPNLELGDDVNVTESPYVIDAGAGYDVYAWDNGTSAQTRSVDINDQASNYYYSVTVTAGNCSAIDSVKVTFNMQPDVGVTEVVSPTSDCFGNGPYDVTVKITNIGEINIVSGTPMRAQYRIDNSSSVEEAFELPSKLNTGDSYNYTFTSQADLTEVKSYNIRGSVSYTEDTNADNDATTVSISINNPEAELGPDTVEVVTFPYPLAPAVSGTTGLVTYSWNYNSSTSAAIDAPSPGEYIVTITDETGCSASESIYLKKKVGIDDNLIETPEYLIKLYPNPVREVLNVEISTERDTDFTLQIFNNSGQMLYRKEAQRVKDDVIEVDVNDLPAGVYFLKINTGKGSHTKRIIIQ